MRILLLFLLVLLNAWLSDYLVENPDFYQLDAYTWESDEFRALRLGEAAAGLDAIDMDGLTSAMLAAEYDLSDADAEDLDPPAVNMALSRRPAEYRKLRNAYETIFADLRYFPIPLSENERTPPAVYENGWLDRRTYGGERGHEGCDIMGTALPRGSYPVVSITDGVVEKVGWLEKGGWRIGIRAPHGLYLYYAHLYDYARDWKEGDPVAAGQLLGFMGDTGYSAVEGTTGNFEVHLHVGMYLRTDHYDELSVNPYWVLKWLEKKRLKYNY